MSHNYETKEAKLFSLCILSLQKESTYMLLQSNQQLASSVPTQRRGEQGPLAQA